MAGFRKRYIWIVIPPGFDPLGSTESKKKRIRIFGTEDAMRTAIPDRHRASPRAIGSSGKAWLFGKTKGKQFIAKKLPIEDSDGLPR